MPRSKAGWSGPSPLAHSQHPYELDDAKPVPSDLIEGLPNPGLPRGTYVATREAPDRVGADTPYPPWDEMTPLQKHVTYFDRNKDGVIQIHETIASFRALGFNLFIAVTSALAFHLLHVSYPTSASWLPDLRFPVSVARIHRAKHGSDTESYDTEGRFVPQKFEEIFSKYDLGRKGGLTPSDIVRMIRGNRNAFDPVGWIFQIFLWGFLYILAADHAKGVLAKDAVRRQYDGSLYYAIERRRELGERLPWYFGGKVFNFL